MENFIINAIHFESPATPITPSILFKVAVILAKEFPIFTVILLGFFLLCIGLFIKSLTNEKNAEIRIKILAKTVVLAIVSPVVCYFFVIILYPVFF